MKRYSEQEKSVALALLEVNQGNLRRTAKQAGIPHATLRKWSRGEGVHPDVHKSIPEKRASLEERFQELIHQLMDVVPSKMEDAPLDSITRAIGIFTDKLQVQRGEPDTITRSQHATREERVEAILAFIARDKPGQALQPDGQAFLAGDAGGPENIDEAG